MIRILAVGKMKDKRLAELTADYLRRLRPLAPVEVIEIRDAGPEKEGRELVAKAGKTGADHPVIALDEHGEDLTSVEFSQLLSEHASPVFLIGGPDGLTGEVFERATRRVRLSAMTWTHEMARMLLTEQIYRGLSILRGKPYHRP